MSVECLCDRVDKLSFILNDNVPFLLDVLISLIESKGKVAFFFIFVKSIFKNCQVSCLFKPKQTNVGVLPNVVFQRNISHTVCLKIDNVNASLYFGKVINNCDFFVRYHYEVGRNGAVLVLFREQNFTLSVDMVYFNQKHSGCHF